MNPFSTIITAVNAQGTCALVTLVLAEGSTPRDAGAWMIVTPHGYHGTIGGGTMEWHAMAEAQGLLGKPATIKTIRKSLGPDLGQCCGGRVTLEIESFDRNSLTDLEERAAHFHEELRHIHIWGAGHVGRALVLALAPLPFRVTWWDIRPDAFPAFMPQNVTGRRGAPSEMEADQALVLVMSHSHALDFDVVDFALRNPGFAQVGLIGSATKRARFKKRLGEAGHDTANLARLTCPIGVRAVTSKLPAAIAAGVVVQLLEWDEELRNGVAAADIHTKMHRRN
jgi:xanthine dehydrogenase accessory factor